MFVQSMNETFHFIFIGMSHLRDIQKLRQSRNPSTVLPFTHRSSQQSPLTPEYFSGGFEKLTELESRNLLAQGKQTYSKFLQSKELLPKTRQQKTTHKRGLSNGLTFYERKQSDPFNNGLPIYNISMKLNARTPNPLTYRKDKKQDFLEFQSAFELKQKRIPSKSSTPRVTTISEIATRNSFDIHYPIGKGGFGKVWKVQHKKSRQIFALKQMYKAKIIAKKSINSVMNQRKLLSKLHHSFIINMTYAFQDRENLYLIMDYLDGGDLRYHIGRRGKFTQSQSKFFIANIIIGLQYMHINNVIHRDIKPENIVLDKEGYLRITDMGISRQWREDNQQDTSGTPGYMAPEVMVRKNHSFQVDYFALGVMGYEFMLGRRPYIGKNRKEIRDQILAKQAGIRMEDLPKRWSIEAADFINKLLIRSPSSRLGANGIQQLKSHPWLRDTDWQKLLRKQIRAPYIPVSIQQDYEQYKQQISEDTIEDNAEDNMLMLRDKEVQSLFQGYEFDRVSTEKQRSMSNTTNCTESDGREGRKTSRI